MKTTIPILLLALFSFVSCEEQSLTGQLHVNFYSDTDDDTFDFHARIYSMENLQYILFDNLTAVGRTLKVDNLNPGNYVISYRRDSGGSGQRAFQINAGRTTTLDVTF